MANKKLIDAKALFDDLADYWGIPKDWDGRIEQVCEDALSSIENAPEVDAVEVVHGRWIEGGKTMVGDVNGRILHCSECGDYCYNFDPNPPHNYCPNCGADMRERKDNG